MYNLPHWVLTTTAHGAVSLPVRVIHDRSERHSTIVRKRLNLSRSVRSVTSYHRSKSTSKFTGDNQLIKFDSWTTWRTQSSFRCRALNSSSSCVVRVGNLTTLWQSVNIGRAVLCEYLHNLLKGEVVRVGNCFLCTVNCDISAVCVNLRNLSEGGECHQEIFI